jgi:hypothetical protein
MTLRSSFAKLSSAEGRRQKAEAGAEQPRCSRGGRQEGSEGSGQMHACGAWQPVSAAAAGPAKSARAPEGTEHPRTRAEPAGVDRQRGLAAIWHSAADGADHRAAHARKSSDGEQQHEEDKEEDKDGAAAPLRPGAQQRGVVDIVWRGGGKGSAGVAGMGGKKVCCENRGACVSMHACRRQTGANKTDIIYGKPGGTSRAACSPIPQPATPPAHRIMRSCSGLRLSLAA